MEFIINQHISKIFLTLFFLFAQVPLPAQDMAIPTWFANEMEAHVGTWIASNSTYQSESEAAEHYGITWDPATKRAAEVQYGTYTTTRGIGYLEILENGETKLEQQFNYPDDSVLNKGHKEIRDETTITSTSFDVSTIGVWTLDRTYVWIKQTP